MCLKEMYFYDEMKKHHSLELLPELELKAKSVWNALIGENNETVP